MRSAGVKISVFFLIHPQRGKTRLDKAVAGSSEYDDVVAAAGIYEQDGEPNSASTNSDKQALPSGMLPFRTVAGGIDAALYGTPDIGEKKIYPSFHEENPLLYLELRRNNRYMDPLLFIEEGINSASVTYKFTNAS